MNQQNSSRGRGSNPYGRNNNQQTGRGDGRGRGNQGTTLPNQGYGNNRSQGQYNSNQGQGQEGEGRNRARNQYRRQKAKAKREAARQQESIPTTGFQGTNSVRFQTANTGRVGRDVEEEIYTYTPEEEARNAMRTLPLTEFNEENQHMNYAPLAPAVREDQGNSRNPRRDVRQEIRPVVIPPPARTFLTNRISAASLPPAPELQPFLTNRDDDLNSLPSLEDVPTSTVTQAPSSRPSEEDIPVRDQYYLNEESEIYCKQFLKEKELMDHLSLKQFNIRDMIGNAASLALENIIQCCGLQSNYKGLMKQGQRLLFAPIETLWKVATGEHHARSQYRSWSTPSRANADLSKVACIDFEELIGPKRLKEIKDGNPAAESLIKILDSITKRVYPNQSSEIKRRMMEINPSPKLLMKLVTKKSAYHSWLSWLDMDLVPNPPKLSCLIKLREEVDQEKNDEMEELSVNTSFSAQLDDEMGVDEINMNTQPSEATNAHKPTVQFLTGLSPQCLIWLIGAGLQALK